MQLGFICDKNPLFFALFFILVATHKLDGTFSPKSGRKAFQVYMF